VRRLGAGEVHRLGAPAGPSMYCWAMHGLLGRAQSAALGPAPHVAAGPVAMLVEYSVPEQPLHWYAIFGDARPAAQAVAPG
jgi:hypothetical protein